MKAKDIKPGVVYAYRSSKHGHVWPIIFLAPVDSEHVYATTSSHSPAGTPAFAKARNGSKPGRGSFYSSPTLGYPVVEGTGESAVDAMQSLTLADFEASKTRRASDGVDYKLITTMGHVLGPYDQVKAATDVESAAEAARARKEHDARVCADRRAGDLVERLARHGVVAARDSTWHPVGLLLSFDDVDKLLALLADSSKED